MQVRRTLATAVSAAVLAVGLAFPVAAADDKPHRFPPTEFNEKVVRAAKRGCNACHSDLADSVKRLPQQLIYRDKGHPIIAGSYDIPLRVEDCLPCHAQESFLPFAPFIHAAHLGSKAFQAVSQGQGCLSCHVMGAPRREPIELYDDETAYELMNGIVKEPTPSFK